MAIKQIYPPGNVADLLASPKVPVLIDGDFLFNSDVWDGVVPEGVIVPFDSAGRPMSPVEETTGVVLPIVGAIVGKRSPNRHHGHFYKNIYAAGSLGQRAVRYSRLQWVGDLPHNTFHKAFHGTEFPISTEDEFGIALLNCAGYIPQFGVKIEGRKITLGELTTLERKRLRKPGVFITEKHVDAQATIGKFLMHYALIQDFSLAKQGQIEKFLEITDKAMRKDERLRESKMELAMSLTNKALGLAVSPINPHFQAARKTYSLRKNTPPTPWEVAKIHINGHEADYVGELEKRLVAYAQSA